jgi:hypothetical protein
MNPTLLLQLTGLSLGLTLMAVGLIMIARRL